MGALALANFIRETILRDVQNTRQLPKGNHPEGCAGHARSLLIGALALANFLRETILRDV
ncbi:unnamed protein product [Prunus armeniaca]